MMGRITQGLKVCARGALVYLVWCYGGFLVGPLAVAWDAMYSVPLWVIVAIAGALPLLVESVLLVVDRTQLGANGALAVAAVLSADPNVEPCRRSAHPVRSRARRASNATLHRMERFGRTRLR